MEALRPQIEIDEVASYLSDNWPFKIMELLARFELATRFHKIFDFMEALRPQIEIDEVASYLSDNGLLK